MSEQPSRKDILLRAAYDLIERSKTHFVQETVGIQTFYDDANCDGYCLQSDIAHELRLEEDTPPIPLGPEE